MWQVVSFLTISALCLFCAVTQMDNEYTVVVLSITGNSFNDQNFIGLYFFFLVAKIFSSVSLQSCYLYAAELFPTAMRNTALGSSSTAGRTGALLATWIISSKVFETRWKVWNYHSLWSFLLISGDRHLQHFHHFRTDQPDRGPPRPHHPTRDDGF